MSINAIQGASQPQVAKGDDLAVNSAAKQQAKLQSAPRQQYYPADAAAKDPAQFETRVKAATQQLNDFMKHFSINLNFSIDSDSKQIVVKVVNQQTGELIRQIPSEEALKLSKAMDTLQGLIIREKV